MPIDCTYAKAGIGYSPHMGAALKLVNTGTGGCQVNGLVIEITMANRYCHNNSSAGSIKCAIHIAISKGESASCRAKVYIPNRNLAIV